MYNRKKTPAVYRCTLLYYRRQVNSLIDLRDRLIPVTSRLQRTLLVSSACFRVRLTELYQSVVRWKCAAWLGAVYCSPMYTVKFQSNLYRTRVTIIRKPIDESASFVMCD